MSKSGNDPARELIEAFRADCAPPSAAADANWAAVQARLQAAPATAPEGPGCSSGQAAAPAGPSGSGLLFGVAGGLLLTAVVAVVLMTRPGGEPELEARTEAPVAEVERAPEPEPEPSHGPVATATQDEPEPEPEPGPVATPEPEPELSEEPEPAAKPRAARKGQATDATAPSLEDEIALIAGAKAALASGDPATALAKAREHEKRFKAGKLVDERELLRIKALCAQGRVTKARAERDAFLERKPRAAISSRVREACSE